jgi:multidrug transporter EmrE-like cation transporter
MMTRRCGRRTHFFHANSSQRSSVILVLFFILFYFISFILLSACKAKINVSIDGTDP